MHSQIYMYIMRISISQMKNKHLMQKIKNTNSKKIYPNFDIHKRRT